MIFNLISSFISHHNLETFLLCSSEEDGLFLVEEALKKEIKGEANNEVEELLEEAVNDVEEILDEAENDVEEILDEAHDVEEIVEKADSDVEEILDEAENDLEILDTRGRLI